ncbi:MAG: aldehyde dehydrogenase family protein [Candidatus Omnitrophica bacterium]|nr:aldehyde dehydrogenase family protein [Candidatus Omnitrophota bacterium]
MKTLKPRTLELPTDRLVRHKLLIDGKWMPAQSGRKFKTLNPATEEMICEVAEAGEADIHAAASAARKAFETGPWPKMKARDRFKILKKISELILHNKERLATLETFDSGKPIESSRHIDIPAAAEAFEYYAGWIDKLSGETLPVDPAYFSYTLREPLGVIAAITPWNFPLLIAAQKIAPALAAGNTVILKPAEQTPLTALCLGQIAMDAGLPEGVLNIVPGFGPVAGAMLVRHPEVDGITFTGEYLTGQEIMKNAAPGLKRLHFELGGKSANIIFEDADLDQAADFACDGIFFNQGEVCCAGSRLFVDQKIKKTFSKLLLEKSKNWQPGDPMSTKTEMGAVVSREQLDKILRYIKLGEKEGAQLILDGRKQSKSKGYFVGPTIFESVSNTMKLAQEEIFGPVLSQISFADFDQVLQQANQTIYGLSAALFTRDIEKAHRAARLLKSGTVWINCYGTFHHGVPFGGYKMSGYGREGGLHTFDFYTQMKSVWLHLNS